MFYLQFDSANLPNSFVLLKILYFANETGNILGATELQGPTTYSYKDLKLATKNFSEETKLGKGGYGDVYKVFKYGNFSYVLSIR